MRFTSMRATGQVSAHDHGLTSRPVAIVSAKARSSSTCASSALAWIHAPCPSSTRPASAMRQSAGRCASRSSLLAGEVCARGHRGDLRWPRALWEGGGEKLPPVRHQRANVSTPGEHEQDQAERAAAPRPRSSCSSASVAVFGSDTVLRTPPSGSRACACAIASCARRVARVRIRAALIGAARRRCGRSPNTLSKSQPAGRLSGSSASLSVSRRRAGSASCRPRPGWSAA